MWVFLWYIWFSAQQVKCIFYYTLWYSVAAQAWNHCMNNTQNSSKDLSITKVNKWGINKDYEVLSVKQPTGHHLPEYLHILPLLYFITILCDGGSSDRPNLQSLYNNLCRSVLNPKEVMFLLLLIKTNLLLHNYNILTFLNCILSIWKHVVLVSVVGYFCL